MRQLDFDLLVAEFAGPQFLAERLAGRGGGARADQGVEHAFLGGEFRLGLDVAALALLDQRDADFHEVADDLLDVPPDVADLGELGRLHLQDGAPASSASRRAISVLPQPVGPIINMFFGITSSRIGEVAAAGASVAQRDRHRRLASFWPR